MLAPQHNLFQTQVVMMDDTELQLPPQKKIKTMHTSMDGTMDDPTQSAISNAEPVIDMTGDHQEADHDQLRKEAECGITEFVSPDLQGFTGILKKRYRTCVEAGEIWILMLEPFRYTDFLVNEILPSGLVVHLDNLKGPSRSKQAGRNNDAEKISASVGKKYTHHSPHTEPASSVGDNGDGGLVNKLSLPASEATLPLNSQADEGASSHTVHEPETTGQESQLPKPAEFLLEPSSGPRQKGKVQMRQTSTELILVEDGDKDSFETSEQALEPVSEQKASGSTEDVVSQEASASLNAEVLGTSEDSTSKITQETPGPQPSSVADWQAYADVPKAYQVSSCFIYKPSY